MRGAFSLLELVAFFTAGEAKPAQSWHLRRGLSVWHAAGQIHSDIQQGFVRAEVVGWDELVVGGRLQRRPRPRHAAPRGPRLRGGRRRRDHRALHALGGLQVPDVLRGLQALGQPAQPQLARGRGPALEIGRAIGRALDVGRLQGGDP